MKARVLKKILNDTSYIVSNTEDHIRVGSHLCPELFNIDKKTLKLKYVLSSNARERFIKNDDVELLFIWDKLQELIDSGEINDIINGTDTVENSVPVFTVRYFKVYESVTEELKYPNIDADGNLIYLYNSFPTRKLAILYALQEITKSKVSRSNQILEASDKIDQLQREIDELENSKQALGEMLLNEV